MTIRFFQESQDDSCSFDDTSSALAFTTSSIPVIQHCFNFEDLMSGNASQGFVNQTGNLGAGSWNDGDKGIYWTLQNHDSYDPSRNYSSVLYRQHITNPGDKQHPGEYSRVRVNLYGGENCTQKDPNSNTTLFPWYGFSCWSEDQGSCGTMPFRVASFYVFPAPRQEDQQGKCWVFAEEGAGTSVYRSSQATLIALTSTALALWLAF